MLITRLIPNDFYFLLVSNCFTNNLLFELKLLSMGMSLLSLDCVRK